MPSSDRVRYTIAVCAPSGSRLYGVYALKSAADKLAATWRRKITKHYPGTTVAVVPIRPATASERRHDWSV